MCDSCFNDYLRAGKAWKAPRTEERQLKRILQTLCRWMLMPSTMKVARARKARAKANSKVTETNKMPKVKANSQ